MHEKARRSHPDPATLDADFSRVVRAAGLTRHHLHLTELRVATAMLHASARATKEHFQDFESNNLGDIMHHLEAHRVPWASAVAPELTAFLEAITKQRVRSSTDEYRIFPRRTAGCLYRSPCCTR
ncbi:unnamed protein product [Ectocarpus sp. 4 AP-2014]